MSCPFTHHPVAAKALKSVQQMCARELLDRCFDEKIWNGSSLFNEAFRVARDHFTNDIHFYAPGMVHFEESFYAQTNPYYFPGISVTGTRCWLNCEHCRGRILHSLLPANTPEELLEICWKIKMAGGSGCLVSGGSLKDGSVPLMDFISAIRRAKRDFHLSIVVHTGLISPDLAEALADAGVDAAMIDVIGSDDTMKDIYHLEQGISCVEKSLALLDDNRIPIVPHIVAGIHHGRLRGERHAVEMIYRYNPAAVVVVVFMPLEGTPLQGATPPTPLEVSRLILASRLMMPSTPLLLGCARPRGSYKGELDELAIRAGVNGIAYPSVEAYDVSKKLELRVRFHEECCSLIWKSLYTH